MRPDYFKKLFIIALLIAVGLSLEVAGLFETENVLALGREYVGHWWLILIIILLQIILFTFALAGSVFLWLVAPLYPPVEAALILASGSTIGGVGAYLFSRYITDDWVEKIESSRTYQLLHEQDNFFVLFALRVFPAFPQSFINYSSGILKVKLSHFVLAAMSGVFIKSYIYSDVIYSAASSKSIDALLDISTYGPLILLSMLILLGVFIKYKLDKASD